MTDKILLEGDEAMELWKKGSGEWNFWVEANPVADVSFEGVNFSQHRTGENNLISFTGYKFPQGKVNFTKATFGVGDVDFDGANFGDGNVNFAKAIFGEGEVNFRGATFGNGEVRFWDTAFGKGKVIFVRATFGVGDVDFRGATFEDEDVDFSGANFGGGNVNFAKATFGTGEVNFKGAHFGEGNIDFDGATFGDGNVNFAKAIFGEGNVNFSQATFGEGNVNFSNADFGGGAVQFSSVIFNGSVYFSGLKSCEKCTVFSFRNVSFNKIFTISGKFGCVVDMVGTKTSHHVELSGLTCALKRERYGWFIKKAIAEKDAARLRRLKELAEQNKHHEAALRFHADEMRAKRWNEIGTFASLLDMIFSGVSNYGQSILRPVFWLILITLTSFLILNGFDWPINGEAVQLAVKNSLPFLPAARTTTGGDIPSILHQLLAIIFIFLIGLGLRNRFRI